jgi:hypothetical protein
LTPATAVSIKKDPIPILEICLLRGKSNDFFYAYGARFCNGVECPEFIGIYTMEGIPVFESISTVGPLSKNYKSLEEVSTQNQFNINEPAKCLDVAAGSETRQ